MPPAPSTAGIRTAARGTTAGISGNAIGGSAARPGGTGSWQPAAGRPRRSRTPRAATRARARPPPLRHRAVGGVWGGPPEGCTVAGAWGDGPPEGCTVGDAADPRIGPDVPAIMAIGACHQADTCLGECPDGAGRRTGPLLVHLEPGAGGAGLPRELADCPVGDAGLVEAHLGHDAEQVRQ